MGFELAVQEERIILYREQNGQTFELVHVLRRPSTSEEKEWDRRRVGHVRKGRQVRFEDRTLEADAWLWSQLVRRVEGYTLFGKPLMEATEEDLKRFTAEFGIPVQSWRDLVPLQDRREAVERLLGIWTPGLEFGEEEAEGEATSFEG